MKDKIKVILLSVKDDSKYDTNFTIPTETAKKKDENNAYIDKSENQVVTEDKIEVKMAATKYNTNENYF